MGTGQDRVKVMLDSDAGVLVDRFGARAKGWQGYSTSARVMKGRGGVKVMICGHWPLHGRMRLE